MKRESFILNQTKDKLRCRSMRPIRRLAFRLSPHGAAVFLESKTMDYKYMVVRKLNSRPDETGEIVGPGAFSMAHDLAQHWAKQPKSKAVRILRADTTGINADKFFLHLIVNP